MVIFNNYRIFLLILFATTESAVGLSLNLKPGAPAPIQSEKQSSSSLPLGELQSVSRRRVFGALLSGVAVSGFANIDEARASSLVVSLDEKELEKEVRVVEKEVKVAEREAKKDAKKAAYEKKREAFFEYEVEAASKLEERIEAAELKAEEEIKKDLEEEEKLKAAIEEDKKEAAQATTKEEKEEKLREARKLAAKEKTLEKKEKRAERQKRIFLAEEEQEKQILDSKVAAERAEEARLEAAEVEAKMVAAIAREEESELKALKEFKGKKR